MAAGSEKLSWKLLGGPKTCSVCQRKLVLAQVREHGMVFPTRREFVICTDCWPKRPT